MTTASLSWGCALLAFSPSLSLLVLLAYKKAQLIIVVTTSAFAFLLSIFVSSLFWLPVPSSLSTNALLLILPSVLSQAFFRCGFVEVYHRVEDVIAGSVRAHERHERERRAASSTPPAEDVDAPAPSPLLSESALLRLELNDWTCGIAAGTGFGGMHAVMLYGTLLASESSNVGTLYQPSCPNIPSLVNSAITAFFFAILDLTLMLLTFYGMRRRKSGGGEEGRGVGWCSVAFGRGRSGRCRLPFIVDVGWRASLTASIVAHLAAALATTPNRSENGCLVALPLLATVVVVTVVFFVVGVSKDYLPESQRRRTGMMSRGGSSMGEESAWGGGRSYHED